MNKRTGVKFTLLAAIFAVACFACLATQSVAFADEEASLQISSNGNGNITDVYLGSGTQIRNYKATVDQVDARSSYADAIKRIRLDAYNDSNITLNGVSISYNLDMMGIKKEDYLKMTWSNALERIAIQRAVESTDSTLGSKRPNGTSCYTATYQNIAADKEIQVWNNSTFTTWNASSFIAQIAWEKQNYVDELTGVQAGKPYSNYLALIDPTYTCVGVATTDGYDKKYVGVMELGKKLQGLSGSTATGLKGTYNFEMAVGGSGTSGGDDDSGGSSKLGDVSFCMDVTGCYRMNIGTTYKFNATVKYRGQDVDVNENWYSTDESVISIDASTGLATAKKAGTIEVYLGGTDGYKVPHKITVPQNTEMFREYNKYDGQHLFTDSAEERDTITAIGWTFEDIGWTAPRWKKNPLYRVYNPYSGDHHYTMDLEEYNTLGSNGWNKEGVACYSADASNGIEVYRLFNPYEKVGTHHYTTNKVEYDYLGAHGWQFHWDKEGIGWYALKQ